MKEAALATGRRFRIVLLEDDKPLSRLIEHCLHDWFAQAELVTFKSGDEAWQELARSKPDLLILDWKHPGLTGLELLRRLALAKAAFPILLTSIYFAENVQLFSDQGLKLKFLPKPFYIWELWDAVNELLGPSDYLEMQALVGTNLRTQLAGSSHVASL